MKSQASIWSLCLVCFLSLHCSVNARQLPFVLEPQQSTELHGRFLHITDIHPDPNYLYNATIASSCHRINQRKSDEFRKGKDHDNDDSTMFAGYWGVAASDCDSPFVLVEQVFQYLKEEWADKIDFVIWTGDNARHDNDNQIPRTIDAIHNLNSQVATYFKKTFTKNPIDPNKPPRRIPIVPAIGNNDIYPHNILVAGPNRITTSFTKLWESFIPEEQFHTFHRGGYYISPVIPNKLAVFSLNTIYWYESNKAVDGCAKQSPGREEFIWLRAQLRELRNRGMKAYLIGHVPPAYKSYYEDCWHMYGGIAIDFQDVIVGHIFGHANMDHFFFFDEADLEDEHNNKFAMRRAKKQILPLTCRETFDDSRCIQNMATRNSDHEFASSNLDDIAIQSYVDDIYKDYTEIAKYDKWNEDNFAIVNVGPSVIPTYFPSLRIFEYNVTEIISDPSDEILYERDVFDEFDVENQKKKKKKKKRKKKDHKHKKSRKNKHDHQPDPDAPSRSNTYLTPLRYTQLFCNITRANLKYDANPALNHSLTWEIEYETDKPPFNMPDLTVHSYLNLARRAVNNDSLWGTIQRWMRVSTSENDND